LALSLRPYGLIFSFLIFMSFLKSIKSLHVFRIDIFYLVPNFGFEVFSLIIIKNKLSPNIALGFLKTQRKNPYRFSLQNWLFSFSKKFKFQLENHGLLSLYAFDLENKMLFIDLKNWFLSDIQTTWRSKPMRQLDLYKNIIFGLTPLKNRHDNLFLSFRRQRVCNPF
jgi:hypothetical protein